MTTIIPVQAWLSSFGAGDIIIRFMKLVIVMGLLYCGAVLGAASEKLEPIGGLHEDWFDSPPVGSARLLAGAFAGSLNDPALLSSLRVVLPKARAAKTLCLWIASRDARYSGSASFDLSNAGPGEHLLALKSRFAPRLGNASAATLAVLASIQDACESPSGTILPVLWTPTAAGRRIYWLVVAHKETTDLAQLPDERRTIACKQFGAEASLIAFDTWCELDSVASGASKWKIRRWHFEDPLPGQIVMIYVP